MRPRDQIDSLTIGVLAVIVVVASAVFFIPASLTQLAGRDAWISVIMAAPLIALMTAGFVFAYFRPGLTPLQRTAGRPLLRASAGVLFAAYATYLNALVLSETSFVLVNVMPRTPTGVFIVLFALTGLLIANHGRETLGRTGLLVYPLLLVATVVNVLLTLPRNADFGLLLPVLEFGPGRALAAVPNMLAWTGEILLITFLADGVRDPRRITAYVGAATAFAWLLIGVIVVGTLVVLGPIETARHFVPTVRLARLVRIAPIIDRIEVLVLMTWLFGIYIKNGLITYVGGLALQKGFGLHERWRALLDAAVAGAGAAIALYGFPTAPELSDHLRDVWPRAGTAVLVVTLLMGLLPAPLPERGVTGR